MILKAHQLKKSFSSLEVLKGVDLQIALGESVAITGKSGEGKSTLLHILGTLEKPSSGSLEICGKDAMAVALGPLRNQHLGFIFQNHNLLEEYTLLDNVLMPAKIARRAVHKGSEAQLRAEELLDKVGLSHRKHFLAKQLSGGEKQRAALARALCNDPPLLLADEPSGNLDQAHSQEVHQLLLELTRHSKKALIVVTHDLQLCRLCDRTLNLKNGYLYPSE